MDTQTLTILFTDLKGFAGRTSRQSRSDNLAMIRRHRALVLPLIQKRGGCLVKEVGDAFLTTFTSPTNAVHAAIEIQQMLRSHNLRHEGDRRLQLRAALCTGEVTLEGGDVYGEAVNIAARLQALAPVGQIWIAESTRLVMQRSEAVSRRVGTKKLTGIPHAIRVFTVPVPQGKDLPDNPLRRGIGSSATTLPAPLWRRGIACTLDLSLMRLAAHGLVGATWPPTWEHARDPKATFVWMGLWLIYMCLAQGFHGKTLGKRLMGLRVVRPDGQRLGWGRSLLRAVLWFCSILPAGLGVIWILFNPRRRAWHDKMAESLVVQG